MCWNGRRHVDIKQGFVAHSIESDHRLAVVKCLEGAWVVLFKVVIDGRFDDAERMVRFPADQEPHSKSLPDKAT